MAGFVSQLPKPKQDKPSPSAQSRREINRANAQRSTGPRSITGKLASSRNSLQHGLASGTMIIPGEDPAAFEQLTAALLEEHRPAADSEMLLVHEMAQSWWLTQRAIRLQNECFTDSGIDEKRLALLLRYQTTHERAFHKALNTLIKLKRSRQRDAIQNRTQTARGGDWVRFAKRHQPRSRNWLRFAKSSRRTAKHAAHPGRSRLKGEISNLLLQQSGGFIDCEQFSA